MDKCKYCLYGYNSYGNRACCCCDEDCEYFTPLTPELEDEMILDIVEQERGEYHEAFFEYVNQYGSFDFD